LIWDVTKWKMIIIIIHPLMRTQLLIA